MTDLINHETKVSRRTLFRRGPRNLMVALLTGWFAAEACKRRRLAGNPNCLQLAACSSCLELNRCRLPRAERYRGIMAGGGAAS